MKGQNKYKMPHMGKDALARAGQLPITLEVSKELAREAITFLIEAGQINGIEEMGRRLGIQERFGLLEQFEGLEV